MKFAIEEIPEICELTNLANFTNFAELRKHKDEKQVEIDVKRTDLTHSEKDKLNRLICWFLRLNPQLCYYQGYHDVVMVLMKFTDNVHEDKQFQIIHNFSLCYLRDFMMVNLNPTIDILKLIPELLYKVDKKFVRKIELLKIQPFYSISSIITIFSHEIKQSSRKNKFDKLIPVFNKIIQLNDFTIVIYLYVLMVLDSKTEIINKLSEIDENSFLTKQDFVHNLLSNIVQNHDKLPPVEQAAKLMRSHPIKRLKSFKTLNRFSMLRASYKPGIVELQLNELLHPPRKHSHVLRTTLTIGVLAVVAHYLLNH